MSAPGALIVFARLPIPGKVKTRLGAVIGMKESARVYDELARRTFDVVRSFRRKTGVEVHLFYDPDGDREDVARWTGESVLLHPQAGRTLGERMQHAFGCVFTESPGPAVIVGTDAPDLTEEVLADAFLALKSVEVVIGPSTDGGYYLLGMKRVHHELFADMEWSTEKVFETTMRRLEHSNATTHVLVTLSDIDTYDDYVRYVRRSGTA
jgi:hypothetical protein